MQIMLLQILPPDNLFITESIFENQLLLVVLCSVLTVFTVVKVTRFLNKQKVERNIG
jgi:hypothetical protein